MVLRRYEPADCLELTELFYQTVHTVNAKDYTQEQLDAWADGRADTAAWNQSLLAHISYVAAEDTGIVGFGDITPEGYFDRLFVHKEFQHRGVASALCDKLEGSVSAQKLVVHASITAKPFFERRGYQVVKRQQVLRKGLFLTNYVMERRQNSL